VTDFLDEKRREISDRLAELKPLIDEYTRLEAAAAALGAVAGTSSSTSRAASTPARRGPGRPRGSRSTSRATAKRASSGKPSSSSSASASTTTRRRAGRRKGSGTRAAQALSFVTGQPGITIPELAAKMGIKQNYLYRVLPGLEQEGKIAKQGRGWHPKG
jgi:hypothetical protein